MNVTRSHAKPRPYESLARLARWLGFDRNPLRRGTDPPLDPRAVVGDVWLAVTATLLVSGLLLRASGPLWSGHRN